MRRFATLLLLTLTLSFPANAFHIMGGEITWECTSNGDYIFRVKIYRDCCTLCPNLFFVSGINVYNNPNLTYIPIVEASSVDISPECVDTTLQLSCANNSPGAVEEFIYESAPITLSGSPPPQGWVFSWEQCCRNTSISNITTPGTWGQSLRAVMYPYSLPGSTTPVDASNCYDSSPDFLARPATSLCTGYFVTMNPLGSDRDLDSLYFDWAPTLDESPGTWPPAQVTFSGGYSFNAPYPGPAQNPNNTGATIDHESGAISMLNYTAGNYVSCIKIESWRCGQKISEVFRDHQTLFSGSCPPAGGVGNPVNGAPQITFNGAGFTQVTPTYYVDTVSLGQPITFTVNAVDTDQHPNGNPQSVEMTAVGGQLGVNCQAPPCATLTPALPQSNIGTVGTTFSWTPTCDHLSTILGCQTISTHRFVFKVSDDFCPIPGVNYITVAIVVESDSVPPPEPKCIEYDAQNGVSVTWDYPPDTTNLAQYLIFYEDSVGNGFPVFDTVVGASSNTYLNTSGYPGGRYFIRSQDSCGVASFWSDTITPIVLQATTGPGGAVAQLTWNAPLNPLPPTAGLFRILREYPPGNWVVIDSTQNLSYDDNFPLCAEPVNYRIELWDASVQCFSRSNIDTVILEDLDAPAAISLDSASVDITNNLAHIGFNATTTIDAEFYIIYLYDGINAAWLPIDTVFDLAQTYFQYPQSNAANEYEIYGVAVVDSCGNRSPVSPPHQTVFLNVDVFSCDTTNVLTWSSYDGFTVAEYRIHVSLNGAGYVSTTVSSNVNTWDHTTFLPGDSLCYFIEAIGSGGEHARSNRVCVTIAATDPPDFTYMTWASADILSNLNEVEFYWDTASAVSALRLERAQLSTGPFTPVSTVSAPVGVNVTGFQDLSSLPNTRSYYYRVAALDTCGDVLMYSQLSRTMYLEIVPGGLDANELIWNEYEGWAAPLAGYEVYRWLDDPANATLEDILPPGSNMYRDDFTGNSSEALNEYCYRIVAIEGPDNPFGFMEVSLSNILCIKREPLLYIPNAFHPGTGIQENETFKPGGVIPEDMVYSMFIYDRWGGLIFSTDDPNEGWDGTYEGVELPMGIYAFSIEYSFEDQVFRKAGTLTLIR